MATQAGTSPIEPMSTGRRISPLRVATAAGLSAAAIFVLCWLGTLLSFGSPTHAYIALFTLAAVDSTQALVEGTLWSLLFGLLSGAVFGTIYNLVVSLER